MIIVNGLHITQEEVDVLAENGEIWQALGLVLRTILLYRKLQEESEQAVAEAMSLVHDNSIAEVPSFLMMELRDRRSRAKPRPEPCEHAVLLHWNKYAGHFATNIVGETFTQPISYCPFCGGRL